jgi:O-antigen biosynthesis protein
MKVIPKGLGIKGLIKLIILSLTLWKDFGFVTLWRKLYNKFNREEEEFFLHWCRDHEPTEEKLREQKLLAGKLPYRPLVSLIMPVYNPDRYVLQAAINSILDQTYDHWELCLTDGSDPVSRPDIQELLRSFNEKDERLHIEYLSENKGISWNSNKALEVARGEYVSLVDHDDTLAPFALFSLVEHLNQNPDLDLLYSDRDLISWDGQKRFKPFFKPDWSPESLISVNYLIHLPLIRKTLLERIGGFDPDLDGAQDWDLFFRIIEKTSQIAHVPGLLYHWRVGPSSTAFSSAAKPLLREKQKRVIQLHFNRMGKKVEVLFASNGFIKIKWLNKKDKKVSVIISVSKNIHWGNLDHLIKRTNYSEYEILLIGKEIKGWSEIKIRFSSGLIRKISASKMSASEFYNLVVKHASGEHLVFMEEDLEVQDPDWLNELSGWIGQPEIGAVEGKILYPDRTILSPKGPKGSGLGWAPFAGKKEYYGMSGSSEWYGNPDRISGFCTAMRKEVFREVGGWQGSNEGVYNSEIVSRLSSLGYRTVYNPYVRLRKVA